MSSKSYEAFNKVLTQIIDFMSTLKIQTLLRMQSNMLRPSMMIMVRKDKSPMLRAIGRVDLQHELSLPK